MSQVAPMLIKGSRKAIRIVECGQAFGFYRLNSMIKTMCAAVPLTYHCNLAQYFSAFISQNT